MDAAHKSFQIHGIADSEYQVVVLGRCICSSGVEPLSLADLMVVEWGNSVGV
jgi:hypothetical protein